MTQGTMVRRTLDEISMKVNTVEQVMSSQSSISTLYKCLQSTTLCRLSHRQLKVDSPSYLCLACNNRLCCQRRATERRGCTGDDLEVSVLLLEAVRASRGTHDTCHGSRCSLLPPLVELGNIQAVV